MWQTTAGCLPAPMSLLVQVLVVRARLCRAWLWTSVVRRQQVREHVGKREQRARANGAQIWAVSWKAEFVPELKNRSRKSYPKTRTNIVQGGGVARVWVEERQLKIGNNGPMIKGEQFSSKPLRFLLPWRTVPQKKNKQNMFRSGKQQQQIPACSVDDVLCSLLRQERRGRKLEWKFPIISLTQAVPPPGNIATGCHPCCMWDCGGWAATLGEEVEDSKISCWLCAWFSPFESEFLSKIFQDDDNWSVLQAVAAAVFAFLGEGFSIDVTLTWDGISVKISKLSNMYCGNSVDI